MTPADFPLYRYRGELIRAIDGDTIEVEIDLGFHVRRIIRVRIAGINCPESYGPNRDAGEMAALAAEAMLEWGPFFIVTHKDSRSFDRWVADLWVEQDGEMVSVADLLVADGHAVRVDA